MATRFDFEMMAYALKLANKGRFTTAPNPNVGCVIVQGNQIVGEGYHFRAGEPHAEVHALRMAGENAQGATAYVTLEPCSHYGRTPPCAKGLIDAKVAKVVCAMQDPNPQVAGKGIQMLREAGIEVEVGVLEQQAYQLNRGFFKRMATGMPFVQLKMAASLDGQTALANGKSQWITSPQARQDVQQFRAQSGAILSTQKTVIDDNASLSVRWNELPKSIQSEYSESDLRQPLRVILDRRGLLTPELKLFHSDGDILQVGCQGQLEAPIDANGQVCLPTLFATLAKQHNLQHIWVEAGATLASSLLKQGLVDELVLYLAPKLMGSDGKGLFSHLGFTQMDQVPQLDIQDVRQVGPDIRIIATIKHA